MKVISHEVGSNAIEFAFDDSYSMTFSGRKQCAVYGGDFEIFGGAALYYRRIKVGFYDPEARNPKLKLDPYISREMFLQRWNAVADYFEKHVASMRGPMRSNDIWFLHARCQGSRASVSDGRRTHVGTL